MGDLLIHAAIKTCFTPLETRESLINAGLFFIFLFQWDGYSFTCNKSRIFCCSSSAWVI
jgi:hypothetical protein